MTLANSNSNVFPSFSNLFDDFFNTELSDWRRSNYSSSNTTLPRVNIYEDNDGFKVEMAAPGMKKADFNIELDNNVLTISSNKANENTNENGQYTRREFSYESFTRSFTLPETADSEKISAAYNDGILRIEIPKKEEAKPKPPKAITIS